LETGVVEEGDLFFKVGFAQLFFADLSMTPIVGSPTGVIERQENLKPQSPVESGLVGKD